MKQVWQCGFCCHTDVDHGKIMNHEPLCHYNPINRYCYTCKFAFEDGYEYHLPGCEKKLDVYKGEDEGNCEGWESEDKEYLRKLKIENICKNLVKS